MKDMIICRCEGVYLSDILEAVIEDANSVPGVKKRKRPGMGYCQGRVCQPVIADILQAKTDHEPQYQRSQSPVRPVKLSDLSEEKGEEKSCYCKQLT